MNFKYFAPLFVSLLLTACPLEAQSKSIDTLLEQAQTFHEEGLNLNRANQYSGAIKAYRKALDIRLLLLRERGIQRPEVLEGIIKGYFNIGDAYQYLYRHGEMKQYLDSCRIVQEAFKQDYNFFSHYRQAKLYHAYGQLYNWMPGIERTLLAYHQALYHFRQDDTQPLVYQQFDQAQVLNDISAAMVNAEVSADSIILYASQALSIYNDLEGAKELEGWLEPSMCDAYINLGYGYKMKGLLEPAEDNFRIARSKLEAIRRGLLGSLQKEEGQTRTSYLAYMGHLGRAYNSASDGLGITLTAKGAYADALIVFNTTIKLHDELIDEAPGYIQAYILKANSLYNLGVTYQTQGKFAEALNYYQEAINLAVPDPQQHLDANGNPTERIRDQAYHADCLMLALADKAQCLLELDRVDQALAAAESGLTYLLERSMDYQDASWKRKLAKTVKSFSETAIWANLYGPDSNPDRAFYFMEQSKIFTLTNAIRGYRLEKVSGVDSELLRREQSLQQSIARLRNKVLGEVDADARSALRDQLLRKRDTLRFVESRIKESDDYQRLVFEEGPIGLSEVKNGLGPQQAMISYFTGENGTLAFLVQKEQPLQYFEIPASDDQTIQQVEHFFDLIWSDPSRKIAGTVSTPILAYGEQLFRRYLAEPLSQTDASRIVILPDGGLHKLPFDALILPGEAEGAGTSYSPRFLCSKYALSYCYSATLLQEMQAEADPNISGTLAFAPTFEGSSYTASRAGLGPLRFNDDEVDTICTRTNCVPRPFIGDTASKDNFLKALEQRVYAILHLATHGKADISDPDNSFISFSQRQAGYLDPEQLLYLRELYGMKIPAEMVVLSGCETNLGPIHNGTGILSLTRGFAFAGANSIVSSLWEVNAESTTELMKTFYTELSNGVTKDIALQRAKMARINDSRTMHPYYWAAFIPVGKVHEPTGDTLCPFWAFLLLIPLVIWMALQVKR